MVDGTKAGASLNHMPPKRLGSDRAGARARRRGDMLDKAVAIVQAAWSGEPVTASGTHCRVDGIRFFPTRCCGMTAGPV